jgi:peptidoglycan/xylan/chitin deacetylase (PgdA/CDA1 family)
MMRRSFRARIMLALTACLAPFAAPSQAGPGAADPGAAYPCKGWLYLTLDTGSMRDADLIADILKRHQVRATFFLASEKTVRGDHSLDMSWAPYWRARAAEGHRFGSHTFDHVYLREGRSGMPAGSFTARPQFGEAAGRDQTWQAGDLCRELRRVEHRFRDMTGQGLDPIWRAPGGRAPAMALEAAAACGFRHVHWADAGFLGDELPSDKFPNDRLLAQALARIRGGDILMAHLGIWSRKDPFAPMLDPLIAGLRKKGFCFATLDHHPDYRH